MSLTSCHLKEYHAPLIECCVLHYCMEYMLPEGLYQPISGALLSHRIDTDMWGGMHPLHFLHHRNLSTIFLFYKGSLQYKEEES